MVKSSACFWLAALAILCPASVHANSFVDPERALLDYWLETGRFSDQADPLDRIREQQRWLLYFRDRALSPEADTRSIRAMLLLARAAQTRRDAMTLEFLADVFLPLYRRHGEEVVRALVVLPFLAESSCRMMASGHASERSKPDREAMERLRGELLRRLREAHASDEAIRACRTGFGRLFQSDSTNSL